MKQNQNKDESYKATMSYLINQYVNVICIYCGSEYKLNKEDDIIDLVCELCGNNSFKFKK